MAPPSRLLILLLATQLGGCAMSLRDNWVPSPNFNERRPNYVIIHQTDSVSHERALKTLTDPLRQVSAHYLVAQDGRITQLVEEKDRAWHAGKSYWGGQTDMNSASIGIELDHFGDAPFEPAQIEALMTLLQGISERYRIPAANHLAHGDVAPGRKVDPNHLFPWKALAERGFGLWCTPEEALTAHPVDPLPGLQALGYDISRPETAMQAFRRHYRNVSGEAAGGSPFDEEDLRVLACLLKKKSPPTGDAAIPSNDMMNGPVNGQ